LINFDYQTKPLHQIKPSKYELHDMN